MTKQLSITISTLAFLVIVASTQAQSYDLTWHTIDGGGAMLTTGGGFELSGTIGQPDAGSFAVPMAGGPFLRIGGFWPAAAATCTCAGDLNGDAQKDGLDIAQFVQCLVAGGACGCAELDGVPGITSGDVSLFVGDLLAGAACP